MTCCQKAQSSCGAARGIATLAIVAVLGLAATLVTLSSASTALGGLRSARMEAKALESRTAAEAGIAWALARLNEPGVHDAGCRATAPSLSQPSAVSLRTRAGLASASAGSGEQSFWACASDRTQAEAWRCSCEPASSVEATATLVALVAQSERANGQAAPAGFIVRVAPTSLTDPQSHRLTSMGCTGDWSACALPSLAATTPDPASASHSMASVGLHRRPLLRRQPAATVTAVGATRADAAVRLINRDGQSAGLVLWSGSIAQVEPAQIVGRNGIPLSDRVHLDDPGLADLDFDDLSEVLLGSAAADWSASPAVTRLDCRAQGAACAEALAAAWRSGGRAFHIRGDVHWPVAGIGRAPGEPPGLLVVDGLFTLRGPTRFDGMVLAREVLMDGRSGPVHALGGFVSSGRVDALGAVVLQRDTDALSRLMSETAGILPRPGSWHEP